MVENFEDITEDLTEKELQVLPDVIEGIKYALTGSQSAKKQHIVVDLVNSYLLNKHGMFAPIVLNSVRLRKFTNYLRKNAMLPIIATSNGYFISENPDVIKSQIRSLKQRSRSIYDAAQGLENYLSLNQNKNANNNIQTAS